MDVRRENSGLGNRLIKSLTAIYKNGDWLDADLTIMIRGKYFLAHKLVFSLYTDHFESPKGLGFNAIHYLPPEVEPEIFELLLEYLYTGCVNCRVDQDEKLVKLGHTLNIKDLMHENVIPTKRRRDPENLPSSLNLDNETLPLEVRKLLAQNGESKTMNHYVQKQSKKRTTKTPSNGQNSEQKSSPETDREGNNTYNKTNDDTQLLPPADDDNGVSDLNQSNLDTNNPEKNAKNGAEVPPKIIPTPKNDMNQTPKVAYSSKIFIEPRGVSIRPTLNNSNNNSHIVPPGNFPSQRSLTNPRTVPQQIKTKNQLFYVIDPQKRNVRMPISLPTTGAAPVARPIFTPIVSGSIVSTPILTGQIISGSTNQSKTLFTRVEPSETIRTPPIQLVKYPPAKRTLHPQTSVSLPSSTPAASSNVPSSMPPSQNATKQSNQQATDTMKKSAEKISIQAKDKITTSLLGIKRELDSDDEVDYIIQRNLKKS